MAYKQGKVDQEKVPTPAIMITERAKSQLSLILENDYTIHGLCLRINIVSKGCEGFRYSIGFMSVHPEDFVLSFANAPELQIDVVMDPFCAYYTQESTLDFIQDFEQDAEGFVLTNHHQDQFQGKFWRKDPGLTPPQDFVEQD